MKETKKVLYCEEQKSKVRFILMVSFCLRSGQALGEEGSALNNLSSVAQRAEVHSLDAETTLLKLMGPDFMF